MPSARGTYQPQPSWSRRRLFRLRVVAELVTFRLILRFCIYVQVQSLTCHTETPFANRPDKTIEFEKPPPVKS